MKFFRIVLLCGMLIPMAAHSAAQTTVQTAPASAERKVLHVAFKTAETGFDPAKIDDLYSRTITNHIFESPYGYDPLNRRKVVPLTAVEMPEVSSDFRTFTVHLKPGIYFADDPAFKGKKRELVAQDYVYSYERCADPALRCPSLSELLETKILGLEALYQEALKTGKFDYDKPVPGLRALDRYTLQFRLEDPSPRFLERLLTASDLRGAVAREVVEYYGADIDAHPVGTGPFKLKQWRRASLIVLERNPDFREMTYDGSPEPEDVDGQAILKQLKGRRLPMIDEVQISIIEEDQPRWLAFLNGQADMIGTLPGPLPESFVDIAVPRGKLAPNLEKRGVQMKRRLNADVTIAVFNMENPVVGGYGPEKLALRRAIGLAYDTSREIKLVRHGQAIPAQSRLMPHTSGFDLNFKSPMSDYSPERAKALLDLYGYVDRDGDGWRDMPDGSPLVLEMLTQGDQYQRSLDQEWDRDMKAIGLRTKFIVAQWPENLKKVKAANFMMWRLGFSAAGSDGQDSMASLYSRQKGEQNLARFSLPAFDKLYERAAVLPDGPERDALFLQAKKIEAAYMPYKDFAHRIATDLTHPWLIGFRRPLFSNDWWQFVDLDPVMRAQRTKH